MAIALKVWLSHINDLVGGVRYSAIPIVSMDWIHDVFITEASVNVDIFSESYLIPILIH